MQRKLTHTVQQTKQNRTVLTPIGELYGNKQRKLKIESVIYWDSVSFSFVISIYLYLLDSIIALLTQELGISFLPCSQLN